MVLVCLMEQQILSKDKGVVGLKEDKAYFNSGTHNNLESTNVKKLIDKNVKKIIEDLEVYQKNGSGWYFKEVLNLEIHTAEFNPMKGSSYIPLPDWISNKKAIVNIQNKDAKCFLWCVLRYLHPKEDKAYFNSGTHINLESTDVEKLIDKNVKKIIEDLEAFQKNGSGWYFKEVVNLEIHTNEYEPMKGSSYIPLPDWISNKKAIINIQNKDEKCFLWCILRYLYPIDKNVTLLTDLKKYENFLNTEGINFPMKLKHIYKFEKLNPSLPGINVFSVSDNNKFYPLRMAEKDCQNKIRRAHV